MSHFQPKDYNSTYNQSLDDAGMKLQAEKTVFKPSGETTSRTVSEEIIQLLEERLVVDRYKRKIGEVIIRKEIETRMVEVPVRREKLIVEQISPERKQLVSLDLGQVEMTGVEVNAPTLKSESDESIGVDAARQFLAEIVGQLSYEQAKVKISFQDPQLQMNYQHWLEKFRAKKAF